MGKTFPQFSVYKNSPAASTVNISRVVLGALALRVGVLLALTAGNVVLGSSADVAYSA